MSSSGMSTLTDKKNLLSVSAILAGSVKVEPLFSMRME